MAEYIFEVKVTKVDEATADDIRTALTQNRRSQEVDEAIRRLADTKTTAEVAAFTVRSRQLNKGVEKTQAHLELVTE